MQLGKALAVLLWPALVVFAAGCQDDVTVPVEYRVIVRSGDPQTVVIEFTLPNGTTSEEDAPDSWTSPALDFEEGSPIGLVRERSAIPRAAWTVR